MRSLSMQPHRHEQRPSLQAYLVALVMLVLIPTVAIVAVALLRAGQSYRDASSQQLLETANVVAQSVQSELQARTQLISAFALRSAASDGASDEAALAGSRITTARVRLTDAGWQVDDTAETEDVPLDHLLETVRRGRMTVSNLIDIETADGTEPLVAVSSPRQVDDNTFEVTTLMGKPQALVQTLMREGSFDNNTVLAVTDGTGRILARSRDAQRYIGRLAPDWEALQAVNQPRGTFEARTVDGPMVIFAFRAVGDTPGWMAVTGEPLALYNARWQQPLLVLLAVSAITVLAALVLAIIVTRRILRPIKYLAQQARLVAEGRKPLEFAGFAAAPSVVAEFDTLRESLEKAEEQTRRSHTALQSSYEALRQAERVAKVGSWSLDLATQRFECSEMVYAMSGADPATPLTLNDLPRLFEPDSLKRLRAAIGRCLKVGEPYGLEVECLRIGGGSFAGYVRGEAVRDEQGVIVGLRGTLQDISEREEERRRIAALADNLPNGAIFRVEERDGAQYVINYISAGIKEIVGLSAAEIMPHGTALIEAVHVDDRQPFIDALVEARTRGTQFNHDCRILRPDGTEVWINCRAAHRRKSDNRLVWDGIARDVTGERQAAEVLRKAKDAAEQAERSKSDFLATMSHEIRTPMNTVIGMTRLTLQTSLTPRQRNYLEKINVSANTLLGIINDILDLSKIEAGGFELEDTVFKLESVLESVSAVMAMPAEEKGLEIAYSVQPGLPRRLRGDPLRLGQVLTNLVSNAVKFTERGDVVVSIEPVQGPGDTAWIRFSVRDTGIGLEADQIARLFRPFTQATQDTTRRYGGTGLGLAICKRLVEMMGGTIGVESTLGVGSNFYFLLPLTVPSDALSTNRFAAPRMVRIKGHRVLVVDDNASARQILSEMVRSFGMEAESVSSGLDALEVLEAAALRNAPFDIVLMDWRMPTMDGLETARRIRDNRRLGHVPAVLMVTAYGREEVTHRAEQLGLQGVLIKPLTESVLFNTLVDILLPSDTEAPAQVEVLPDTAEMYSSLSGKRVLVVDDNAFNREVATDFLLAVGIVVDTAVDGQDAIEKIAAGQFDAVLMDTHMPRKDGLTATRELRRDPRWAQLPIISLTAQARVEDQQASREAGMTAYLTKPIDEILLYRTLIKVLGLDAHGDTNRPSSTLSDAVATDDLQLDVVERHLRGPASAARLLQGFVRAFHDAPQRLRDLLAARDLDALTSLVHAVKGSASYLSSRDLFGMGDSLEHAARSGDWDQVQQQLPGYADRIERLIAATRAGIETLRSRAGLSPPNFDPQRVLADIQEVLPLIERGDYAAAAILERIRIALQDTSHDELAYSAQTYFDELALDSAADALRRLAQHIHDERRIAQ